MKGTLNVKIGCQNVKWVSEVASKHIRRFGKVWFMTMASISPLLCQTTPWGSRALNLTDISLYPFAQIDIRCR